MNPTSAPCAGFGVYCPASSEAPVTASVGFYTYPVGGVRATLQLPCPPGSYCTGGVSVLCPGGVYGASTQLSSPACSGPCTPGFVCVAGSSTDAPAECGGPAVYCPAGAPAPSPVDVGFYTTGGPVSGTQRFAQAPCTSGSYCTGGLAWACPAGRFGASSRLSSADCSGPCADGFYCPPGSASATYMMCPSGYWCARGGVVGCPAGTYNESPGASAPAGCAPCGAGTYSAAVNASSGATCAPCCVGTSNGATGQAVCTPCGVGTYAGTAGGARACTPCDAGHFSNVTGAGACVACAPGSGSARGAGACWPGLLSVQVIDDAPVVPGFSEGDLIVLSFSEPTSAPGDVNLTAALALGGGISGCIAGAAWDAGGVALTLTVTLAGDCAATPESTLVGILRAGVRGGWLTDASGASDPAPPSAALLAAGSWGAPAVVGFMPNDGERPGAWAFDDGGDVGLGVGDVLELRFDSAPAQVPVDTRARLDAVFAFSAPLGEDYTGAWTRSGPYANSVLRITVVAAGAGAASPPAAGVAVGTLLVRVRPSGGLTSLDGSTTPSNASTLLAGGTWGDVPGVEVACASHVAARLVVDWTPVAFAVGLFVECAADEGYAELVYASSMSVEGFGDEPAVITATGFAPLSTVYCRAAVMLSFGAGRKDFDVVGEWASASAVLGLPAVAAVSTASGLMATQGGDLITFSGARLGFPDAGVAVTAAYWPAAAGPDQPATGVYTMGSCAHATAATLAPDGSAGTAVVVQCAAAEGAGARFLWQLTVDGGASAPVPAAVAYMPPVVVDCVYTAAPAPSSDDNADFAQMRVSGRALGPLGGAHVDRVWVARASAPEVAFIAHDCAVTIAHVEITCELPMIAGALLVPTLQIAGQLSSSPALAAPVPAIDAVSCSPSPCDALATLPGVDAIVFHGTGFGPRNGSVLTPFNLIAGGYGSVLLRSSSGSVVQLVGCVVAARGVRIECSSPGGFGLAYVPVVTVFGQSSSGGSEHGLSFAVPHITGIATSAPRGRAVLVGAPTVLTVTGAHFGGPAALLLNGAPAPGVPFAAPNGAQTVVVFNLAALPAPALSNATVWVSLSVLGVPADAAVPLPVAPPVLRAAFPITVIESASSIPGGGCANAGPARYWMQVAGANFGAYSELVSVAISGAPSGDGSCVLCDGTLSDAELVCATNATAGALAVRVGAQSTASAAAAPLAFSVTALLTFVRPSVTAVNDAAAGGAPISTSTAAGQVSFVLPTQGGLCEFIGDNFGQGGLVIMGDTATGSRVYSADALVWNTTRIVIMMPPGEGVNSVVIYQGGIQRPGAVLSLRFLAPVVTAVSPLSGPTAGGIVVTVNGANFGVTGPLVRFLGAGLANADAVCVLAGSRNHTTLRCSAPPGQGSALRISVTVGGQTVVAGFLFSYEAPVVASVTPVRGATAGGDPVLVYGANFGLTCAVALVRGLEVVPFVPRNASGGPASNHTHMHLYAPPADGIGWRVVVTVAGKASAGGPAFAYDRPLLLAASPRSSPTRGGARVEFRGRNFGRSEVPAAVYVAGRPCTAETHTHTALSCVMPAGMGSNLTVSVSVAGQANVAPFTIDYDPAQIYAGRPNTPNANGQTGQAFMGVNFGTEPSPVRIIVGGIECPGAAWLNDNTVKCDLGRTTVGPKNVTITVANQVCALSCVVFVEAMRVCACSVFTYVLVLCLYL